jgi:hypothetical protein
MKMAFRINEIWDSAVLTFGTRRLGIANPIVPLGVDQAGKARTLLVIVPIAFEGADIYAGLTGIGYTVC